MKIPYQVFVQHVPFGKPYRGKRPSDALAYDKEIAKMTSSWPKVTNACQLKVTFVLPANKFADGKFLGPDIDNLMKRLLDNLKATVFGPPSDDSFVVSMEVTKTKVSSEVDAGVHIAIIPLDTVLK